MKMVRVLMIVLLGLLTLVVPSFAFDTTTAIGVVATSGQVSCSSTIATIIGPTTTGRLSIAFQNMDSTNGVYITPKSNGTTSTAGVYLYPGQMVMFDRSSGDVPWYCITSSATVVVGYTEEKTK